jgi:hypothetical protein
MVWHKQRMRWFCLSGLLLLVACGPSQFEQQKLKDGSWQFTCQVSMDECVRHAAEQCQNQRYRILEGTSETRLRDAPPFERAYHTSRLHLECTNDGADVLLSTDKSESAANKPPGNVANVCAPGDTRACVGAAACKGGQACQPDGKAFGPCDCGPVTPVAPVVPTEPTAPGPAQPDAATAPASSP